MPDWKLNTKQNLSIVILLNLSYIKQFSVDIKFLIWQSVQYIGTRPKY